jgi:hypothetical protein
MAWLFCADYSCATRIVSRLFELLQASDCKSPACGSPGQYVADGIQEQPASHTAFARDSQHSAIFTSDHSRKVCVMSSGVEPNDTVALLIAMHGLPAVLTAVAYVAAGMGSVCSDIIGHVAAIELWLQSQGEKRE